MLPTGIRGEHPIGTLVVIGHTTDTTALVTLGSSVGYKVARFCISCDEHDSPEIVAKVRTMTANSGWTTTLRPFENQKNLFEVTLGRDIGAHRTILFEGLAPDSVYRLKVAFFRTFLGVLYGGVELDSRISTFLSPGAKDGRRKVRFLLGSCNLPVKNLADLGGGALIQLGRLAAENLNNNKYLTSASSVKRFVWRRMGKLIVWVSGGLIKVIGWITSYRVNEPVVLVSPLESIISNYPAAFDRAQTFGETGLRFMLHVGDQIYYDFPKRSKTPDHFEYKTRYYDAWARDPHYGRVLSSIPHYMILDDHEIRNDYPAGLTSVSERFPGFFIAPEHSRQIFDNEALKAYRDMVQERQPGETRYYDFECDGLKIFVFDTRTERVKGCSMISDRQLRDFKDWVLENHGQPLLVVSSVPFIAEVKDDSPDRVESEYTSVLDKQRELESRDDDKWSGAGYINQRHQIIDFLLNPRMDVEEKPGAPVNNVVFLVGDMHASYYAAMNAREGYEKRIFLHELAGGPIHQLLHSNLDRFARHVTRAASRSVYLGNPREMGKSRGTDGIRYVTRIEKFQSAANGMMEIEYVPGDEGSNPIIGELNWRFVRTTQRSGGREASKLQQETRQSASTPTICGSIELRR